MTFAHPYFLLLLLLLPVLAWLKGRRGAPPAFVYSSVQLVRAMQNITARASADFCGSLRWLALALFIVALAQPRLSKSTTEVKASGIDIVVRAGFVRQHDTRQITSCNGERVNRIDMAKPVLRRFH